MSNVGKTFWSKRLAEVGFQHINCDDLIEAKLEPELKALGYSGLADMSRWKGQPYDERFSENQTKYLRLESQVMQEVLEPLINSKPDNIVIDTTGSVIHTGEEICGLLQKFTTVVYLETPEHMQEEMFQKYIEHPKPVVFGNIYKPRKNETQTETLARCYRELLEYRSSLYSKYADITLLGPATHTWTTEQFLEQITTVE